MEFQHFHIQALVCQNRATFVISWTQLTLFLDAILRLTETVTSQNKQPPCLNKGGARIFHVDAISALTPIPQKYAVQI